MKTGNGNWKWKLEMEIGKGNESKKCNNHCFLHGLCFVVIVLVFYLAVIMGLALQAMCSAFTLVLYFVITYSV